MKKLGLIFIAGSLVLLSGCGIKTTVTNVQATEEVKEEQPIAVTVQKVKVGDMANSNIFNGRTKVSNEVAVTAEMAGTVEKVYVSEGQKVQKGDTLLTIEGTDTNKSIEQARVSLDIAKTSYENSLGGNTTSQINQLENAITQAQMNYDEALRNYEIYKELFEAEAVAEDQFNKIELSLKQAEQALNTAKQSYETTTNEVIPGSQELAKKQVDQAQVAYDNAVSNLSKLTIKAPSSGTITAMNFDTGEMISQGGPAFIISNTNTLDVQIQVTETERSQFKEGDQVSVRLGEEVVEGKVSTVSTVTDAKTDLYTITIKIDNSEDKFFSGMTAEIELTIDKSEAAVIIPKKALVIEEEQSYVYLCVENKAVKTLVETGLENVHNIEIKSGLKEGDTLVVGGISLIGDGVSLYPVEKEE